MKKILMALICLTFALTCPLFAGGESESTDGTSELALTWWGGQTRHEQTQAVIEAYMAANPDVTITGTPSNWDGYFEKLATQAASGSMPDVVQMDYLYINTYASNGSLLDLTPYTESGVIDVSTIDESLLESGIIDGKLVGIPLTTSIVSFPTSVKVLEEAGVEIPSSDWTWDDFVEICHQVTEKTGKYGFGLIPSGDTNFFNYFVRQHGESLFNENMTALGYEDDQIMIDWLEMWKGLMDAGCIPNPDEYAQIQVAGTDSSPIVTDEAAFIQEWNNFNTKVEATNHLDINARGMLLDAIRAYDGTVVFVSHDTDFIKNLATRILYLSDDEEPAFFEGDYDYFSYKLEEKEKAFIEKKKTAENLTRPVIRDASSAHRAQKERRNQIQRLEKEADAILGRISALEKEVRAIEEEMGKEEVYSDPVRITKAARDKEALEAEIEELNEKWFSISSELETLKGAE